MDWIINQSTGKTHNVINEEVHTLWITDIKICKKKITHGESAVQKVSVSEYHKKNPQS